MLEKSCPAADQLRRFVRGQLPENESERVGEHVEQCAACMQTVHALDVEDTALQSLRRGIEMARQAEQAAPQELLERVRAWSPLLKNNIHDAGTIHPHSLPDAQATPSPAVTPLPAAVFPAAGFNCLAPPQAPDELGRLGTYRVLKVLGRGGMGMVFLAEDTRLRRSVALKVMLPALAQEPESRERFLREARAIAAVEHENIITIYQVDEDRGVPYIAMPLLKGRSLEDCLSEYEEHGEAPAVPLAEILRIGREIAMGLAAAHAHGLTHRDIKPANIWLGAAPSRRVKILDFGLARATSGAPTLTQWGAVLGTPGYMAPEQAAGHKVDGRADLFSLGVVLYRLCTRKLPFLGRDIYAVLMSVATQEPPAPATVNPDVPPALSDLVMKLLAKDPKVRIGSAQDVVSVIVALEKEAGIGQAAAVPSPTPAPATRKGPARVPTAFAPAPRPAVRAITPGHKGGRRWAVVAACLLLLALPLFVYVAASVIRVETAEGTLVIDVNDPEVLVTVKQNNVTLYDKVKDRSFTLTAGKGLVEVYEKGGVGPLKTEAFTLNSGGEATVRVRIVPPATLPDEGTLVIDVNDPEVLVTVKQNNVTLYDKVKDRSFTLTAGKGLVEVYEKGGVGPLKTEAFTLNSGGEATVRVRIVPVPATLPKSFKNSLGIEFVLIPRGIGWLGGGGGKPGEQMVTISHDFYLGKYTVTQGQWKALMRDNPSYFSRAGTGKEAVATITDEDLKQFPVEQVSWEDVQRFIAELNASEHERNTGWVYRLPTEDEWEYVCRGGPIPKAESAFDFYPGYPTNDLASSQANFDGNHPVGNGARRQSLERTTKVGSYSPNRLGLYDMHGNVWQWCEDSEGSGQAIRGGSWDYGGTASRAVYSGALPATGRRRDLGFRLARVSSGKARRK